MNIGSISSAYGAFSPLSSQRTPEAAEARTNGPDSDRDGDDSGAKAVQSSPSPTVNTDGQKIGQLINVSA